ncbi:hypothetical protein TNCV_1271221 [Trichonephila clavipes]|nr:hypothetical protein TNCV_1271221 [Trichonephila clavipes]
MGMATVVAEVSSLGGKHFTQPGNFFPVLQVAVAAYRSRSRTRGWCVMSSSLEPQKIRRAEGADAICGVEAGTS